MTSQHQPDPPQRSDPGICGATRAGAFPCVRAAGHDGWHIELLEHGLTRAWRVTCHRPADTPNLSDTALAAVLDQWTAEQSGDQA